MKKITAIVLAALMVVSMAAMFTSCSGGAMTYKIGVQTATTAQYFVDGDADWGFDGIAGFSSKQYNTGGLAVSDMKNGNVDFCMIDEQPAKALAKNIAGVKVIDIPLTIEEYAFGVDKAQPELLDSINEIIADMKIDGTLDAIISAYATETGIVPITSAEYDSSKADSQLVVATNAAFAPFEYKQGNQFVGIDMAIAKHIADTLGMELVIMDMEFDSVVTSVGTNGIDVAMAGLTVNEKRKESVNFTSSYYNAAQVVMVLSDNNDFENCQSAEDVLAVFASKVK
jgi:ABC-type amino acid transport substrate-binding protein